MRLSCPCCAAEMDLQVLLTHEQARRAVARLAQVSLPFGALTLQYMALFKPASRALSIERMVRLIDELLPDIERRAITRAGRDWAADNETWRAAMHAVLGMRDAGTLRLPLTDHGLLHQVIVNMSDKVERHAERDREAQRQRRRTDGPRDAGPRDLGDLAADMAGRVAATPAITPEPVTTALTTTTPTPAYAGPSRAAQEIKARIEAAKEGRQP